MDKQVAIDILEEIKLTLSNLETWRENGLKVVSKYKLELELKTNSKIKRMIKVQQKYKDKYGEFDKKTIAINKKISEEIKKILNN